GIEDGSLPTLDSLGDKFGTVGVYINFGQGSLSTIEELKYAQINLVTDRKLKNKLLTYQNELISFLRDRERRYDDVGEDVRRYYTEHFSGFAYEAAMPHDLSKLMKDKTYLSLVKQRYNWNQWLLNFYAYVLQEQKGIQQMIEKVKNDNCNHGG
ncbi:MAG: hypothetical protein AAF985_27220, partial [Bacteroidota bacterium]